MNKPKYIYGIIDNKIVDFEVIKELVFIILMMIGIILVFLKRKYIKNIF